MAHSTPGPVTKERKRRKKILGAEMSRGRHMRTRGSMQMTDERKNCADMTQMKKKSKHFLDARVLMRNQGNRHTTTSRPNLLYLIF